MDAEADIPEPIPLLREEEEIKYMTSNLLELAKTELKPHAGDPSIPSEQNGCTEGTRNTQIDTNITEFMKPVSEGHLQISDSTSSLPSESGAVENPGEEACKTLEVSETNEIPQVLAENETLDNEERVENDSAIRVNKATGLEDSEASKRKEEEERSGKNHVVLVPQETSPEEHQTGSGKEKDEPRIIVGEGINKDCENPVKTLANEESNEVIEEVNSIEDALTSTDDGSRDSESHYEILKCGNIDEKVLEKPTENTSSNHMSRNEEHELLAGASNAEVEASRQMVDIPDEPKVVTQIQSVNVPEDSLNEDSIQESLSPKVVTEIQSDNVLQESPKEVNEDETDKFDDTAADVSQEADDEKLGKIGASDKTVQVEELGAAVAEADISDGVISDTIYVTECEIEIDHSLGDSIQETEEHGIEKHAEPLTSNIPEVAYSAVSCEKAETKGYLEQTSINEEKFEEGEGDMLPHHDTVGEDSRPEEKNQPPFKIIEETKDLEVSIT